MEVVSMSPPMSLFETTLLMTLIPSASAATAGNILGGKPSTDPKGNDELSDTCMFTDAQPTPYWQVDLQGYYDVHNITLETCWGSWGWKTRSVKIQTYFSNPNQCPGAVGFLYGTTPAGTGESQTHVFHATPTYRVRYIRLVATTQPDLGLKEALAMGTPTKRGAASKFSATPGKKVQTALTSITTTIASECAVKCHVTESCLAFAFNPSLTEDNCFLSDCSSTTDEIGWTVWILDPGSFNTQQNC
ncbi:uncharacterized protein LOC124151580 isoform X2 [Haliotis rufescens]|uniref:uncharacterized protein LOC124151580 isoform X2 n=1 Tax=Haliotis rufescens TaxID=6454 RepID=UPI001EAF917D|nr:uncharacterized protein LOC124151580 isoform X2 [Haliotis rufescens]